jgi:hypothetical protein
MKRFSLIFAAMVLMLNAATEAKTNCVRTVVIGDSQMAYGITPFKFPHTLTPEQLSSFSYEALGTYLFRYFAGPRNECADSVFVYSQGGSGVFDWIGEAKINGQIYPRVRFIGGSRMILQPGFSWMTDQVGRLTPQEQSRLEIGPVTTIVHPKSWIRPARFVIGLSANDWGWDEALLIQKYTQMLKQARGKELRECYLMGVAGVMGSNSPYLSAKGEPPYKTDENVQKLVRAGKVASRAAGCKYIDVSSVHPSEPDGLHLGGISARQAFDTFKVQFESFKTRRKQ